MIENIFAIYKPKGLTSHDVVSEIRKITGIKKVGHAGTLDPLARGVLVIGIGRFATKQLHEIVLKEKKYTAKIYLGKESATDDEEGEKKEFPVTHIPTNRDITNVVKNFIGNIFQVPPKYSAIKIRGRAAYKRARSGEQFKLHPREVLIKKISIVEYKWPNLILEVITGPGVYIRALARDIGRKLETGGYLVDLERVRVGNFTKKTALTLDKLKDLLIKNKSTV